MLTVIYEQPCTFCTWCRHFVERRSTATTFIGHNTEEARTLLAKYPDLYKKCTETIIVFEPHRHPVTKFTACKRIATHMRQPWPFIASILGIIPIFLGNLGYDTIVRIRPQLSRLVGPQE